MGLDVSGEISGGTNSAPVCYNNETGRLPVELLVQKTSGPRSQAFWKMESRRGRVSGRSGQPRSPDVDYPPDVFQNGCQIPIPEAMKVPCFPVFLRVWKVRCAHGLRECLSLAEER